MGTAFGQIPAPQPLRPKGIADVVICIDCTGSMTPCIEGVKQHVQKMVEGFAQTTEIRLDWRVRLIEYRDLTEREPIKPCAFTADIEAFRRQVQPLTAKGGGDEPESTLDALLVALRSPWRHPCNKCVIIFTDATPHPTLHESTVEPGQPRDLDEVIQQLFECGARLFLFGPDCPAYRRLAETPYVEFRPVPKETGLKDIDFAEVLEVLGKTVSASTAPIPVTGRRYGEAA